MAIVVTVKVFPSAGRTAIKLDKNGMIKCYLLSPAEKNKANNELIDMLAKKLGIPARCIMIIAGATSKTKKIEINVEVSLKQLYERLGIDRQLAVF